MGEFLRPIRSLPVSLLLCLWLRDLLCLLLHVCSNSSRVRQSTKLLPEERVHALCISASLSSIRVWFSKNVREGVDNSDASVKMPAGEPRPKRRTYASVSFETPTSLFNVTMPSACRSHQFVRHHDDRPPLVLLLAAGEFTWHIACLVGEADPVWNASELLVQPFVRFIGYGALKLTKRHLYTPSLRR